MLFRRDIEPSCAYCAHGDTISEEQSVCTKRGVTDIGGSCPAFKYDPLKREPQQPANLPKGTLTEKDFQID